VSVLIFAGCYASRKIPAGTKSAKILSDGRKKQGAHPNKFTLPLFYAQAVFPKITPMILVIMQVLCRLAVRWLEP
jgi:hypothetical protein